MDAKVRKIKGGEKFSSILHFDGSTNFHLISEEFRYPKEAEMVEYESDKGKIVVAKMNAFLGMKIVLHGMIEKDGMMLPWSMEFAPTGVEQPDSKGHEEA